jgi:hypothetical protein
VIEIPKEGDGSGLYEAMMLKLGPKTLAWVLGLAEEVNAHASNQFIHNPYEWELVAAECPSSSVNPPEANRA